MRSMLRLIATCVIGMGVVGAQDQTVTLTDQAAPAGATVVVAMLIDNDTGGPIQGFSFSFWNETGELVPQVVAAGADLAELNGGTGPDYLSVTLHPDDGLGGTGISCGTVFSFLGTDALDPGLGIHALDMSWMIDSSAAVGTLSEIQFCDCLGAPPIASAIVIGGASIVPLFDSATVEVLEPTLFLRGDPNSSGAIDIADPINALNYLFQGGPANCLNAMDANGDDTVDLGDALYLLGYINGSGPMPPEPFPACGSSTSLLGCASYSACE